MSKRIFKLEIDQGSFDRMFSDLPNVTKKATANALNVVVRKVNKNIREHISQTYTVPKAATKFGDLVSIKRANANRNIGVAIIFIKRRGRDLLKYGATQIKEGLSVKVKAGTEVIKGGFIAPMWKRGAEKVAMSKGKGKRAGLVTRTTKKGTPYKAAKRQVEWGPQIATLYTNQGAVHVMNKTIDDEFQKELDKQFNMQFEKRGR
ncbi:MAG: hypothetical protein V3U75_11740 [Methylococcaceae bacterium]